MDGIVQADHEVEPEGFLVCRGIFAKTSIIAGAARNNGAHRNN
jgi:hypothetical protein